MYICIHINHNTVYLMISVVVLCSGQLIRMSVIHM